MNRFSVSGAREPETLRGTLIRQQIATTGMKLEITDEELEKISGYLGHTPKIHISNLVLQCQTRQNTTSSTDCGRNQ